MEGIMVNVDHLLHEWLTHQQDVTARKKSVVNRQTSVLNKSNFVIRADAPHLHLHCWATFSTALKKCFRKVL